MVDFIEDRELFNTAKVVFDTREDSDCLLYTSPSPRD